MDMDDDFRILLAVDLQAGTDQLLAEAKRYGIALKAIVDIIHVAPEDPDFVGYIKSESIAEKTQEDLIRNETAGVLWSEHQQTQAIGTMLEAGGVRVGQTLTVQGPILETVVEHARKLNSKLLMLGSHHHGAFHRLWYGDAASEAAKQAPCALLLIPVQTA